MVSALGGRGGVFGHSGQVEALSIYYIIIIIIIFEIYMHKWLGRGRGRNGFGGRFFLFLSPSFLSSSPFNYLLYSAFFFFTIYALH